MRAELILHACDLLGVGPITVETVLSAHGASEADVRAAIGAVEDRLAGALNPPHPRQLLATFEEVLPSWQPDKQVGA